MSSLPTWKENKPFVLAFLVVAAFLSMFLWAKTNQTFKLASEVGKPVPVEHDMVVEGQAKVSSAPDIATVTFGVENKADQVADAQDQNTKTMNALLEKVKALGIAVADIQTSSYNANQNFVWNPTTNTNEPKGWIVSQQVTVKVRDTSKISSLLEVAGKNGATNISGPNFTLDDQTALKDKARVQAMQDVAVHAAALQQSLGVRFERIVGYTEWVEGNGQPMPYAMNTGGMGADMAVKTANIEPGSTELILHTSVVYKLVE